MVCPRCITAVQSVLNAEQINAQRVTLGEVVLSQPIDQEQKDRLRQLLDQMGFELLEAQSAQKIAQIKALIVDQIHHSNLLLSVNFSTLLSDKLHQDYTALSKLFSSTEGITIEKFILKQKIEKVKELMIYDELTLSEIAHQLNYSSVPHLSSQFKKETGLTPTAFKKLERKDRKALDEL